MTKEQIKAKAKGQFPNDEFKQEIVIDAINWATKELEKENAELKRDFKICEKNADTYYDQLTKAKEIIKSLLGCLRQDTNDPETNYYVCQYMDKAEQFLSEVKEC